MTDAFPGRPDEGPGRTPGRPAPETGSRQDRTGADSWLRARRRGRAPSHLPLHVEDAYIVGRGIHEPMEGLVRFRGPDAGETVRERRTWRPPGVRLERQLCASSGELRMIRDRSGSSSPAALTAMLTLNGVTDRAVPLRLSVFGPLPPGADDNDGAAEHDVPVAVVGIDVRFSAAAWRLPLPAHAQCHVHLEAVMRLLPGWPLSR